MNRWSTAKLDKKGWLYRAFEVTSAEGVHRVVYNGRGLGHEHVTVSGKLAVGHTSTLWFVPEFSFFVGSIPALLTVRVWPWFAIRSLELIMDGQSVYSE